MAFPATNPTLARALTERDYLEATPVQLAVLKPESQGRDLLVSAQTGSGKTVAYGLAIAEDLLGDAEVMERAAAPLALVVAPTRELALQVHRELAWLYAGAKAKVVSCVGGMDPRRERRLLAEGAHIVVGTPGRLRDHIERKGLDVSQLKALVLDEADEMLDLGFREDLEEILKLTPRERRTLLFSATLPKVIVNLAREYQRDAFRIEVGAGVRAHADIEYRAMRVLPNEVDHAVVNLLRFYESPSALVFCNTREAVRHMHAALLERGFTVVALSGELSQNERTHALQSLRDGRARICVATDVAARGIDLPNLGLVVHAEIPNDAETLQHRSGRTGRAGKKGIAVLVVTQARRRRAERLLVDAGVQPTWCGPPTVEEIRKLDQERLMRDEVFSDESTDEDVSLARALLAERSAEEVAAALVRMYRQRLPSPEDVVDPGHGRSESRPVRAERAERPSWQERNAAAAPARSEGFEKPRSPSPARSAGGPRGAGVWFHIDIGRKNNADPKWLLPMICKRGKVSRDQIGAIRIFDKETKFEVTADAAEAFAVAMMHPGKETKAGQADLNFTRLDQSAPVAAPSKFNKKKREPFGDPKPGDAERTKFRKEQA
ncbi:MAG: ATP-dependent helicase DeaD [Hyphomicrobiales bacterium]|nr:ATP-dependent helicase DeaD [Hyphomicrobiales bacterium]